MNQLARNTPWGALEAMAADAGDDPIRPRLRLWPSERQGRRGWRRAYRGIARHRNRRPQLFDRASAANGVFFVRLRHAHGRSR